MAVLNQLFFGILILQIYVNAAPSVISKLEDIAKVETAGENLDAASKEIEDNSSAETTRQKRFYNPYGYGFPPISPLIYPNFNKRDDFLSTGNYGVEDPLVQIHQRVQEIANIVRQPQLPGIPHVPIFYPVLFVPTFDCRCNPTNSQPSGPSTSVDNQTASNVSFPNRFPDLGDERRNWGLFINQTDENNDDDQDFSRPISFDPIKLNRPNARPAPPVEHGTVQGDAADSQQPQSEANVPPPPSTRPPSAFQGSSFGSRPSQPRPQNGAPVGPPTPCDGAILTCCHRPQVVYDCFAIQGCPNFTPYGNPCETSSILRVIERFQQFYGNRSG